MECNFENCPNFERLGKKFADRILELEQENDRLKEENKLMRQLHKDLSDKLFEFQKIEDILQEIKTIAEKLMADNLCNNCDGIGLDANCQDTGCPYYQMDKILQKLTKVEEEWNT